MCVWEIGIVRALEGVQWKGGRHRVGESFAESFVAVVREESFRLRSIGQDRLTSSREKKTKLAFKLTVSRMCSTVYKLSLLFLYIGFCVHFIYWLLVR